MNSYRTSHVGDKRGHLYDATHENKVDALVWDVFIKDLVKSKMHQCVEQGGKSYLDFACGTGRVLKLGSQYFDRSLGVDISKDMMDVARERVPSAEFICADVTSEPNVTNEKFDFVTLFRFLLNAEEALSLEVLNWLAEHMPKGAILVCNNHMNTLSFRGVLTLLSNFFLRTRLNHKSKRKTLELLEKSGFKVTAWSGYRFWPTVKGKPLFGRNNQLRLERLAHSMHLGAVSSELVFIAERA